MQFENVDIKSISGSASQGGWQATISLINDDSLADYGRELTLYTLSEGDGVWEGFNNKALIGSIIPQSTIFDSRQSNTSLSVRTSDMFLQNAAIQGIYFSSNGSPANPHQIADMNLGKIIRHILTEHTNMTTGSPGGWVNVEGIDTVNSTPVSVYTVRQSNSIWSTLESIASNEFYVRYFTRNDEFIYKPHPQFDNFPAPAVTNFSNSNIVGQPEIIYREKEAIEQVQLYALSDSGEIFESFYPDSVGTEVRRHKYSNLRCNSQGRLDTLAYRAFYHMNRTYDFRLSIAGAWGLYLDLYDRVTVTYTGTDINGVSIDWDTKYFWIDSINVSKRGNSAITELILNEENVA